jgi:hypothetical protein
MFHLMKMLNFSQYAVIKQVFVSRNLSLMEKLVFLEDEKDLFDFFSKYYSYLLNISP